MAGKIDKENMAMILAKMLLVNKDLKNLGIFYENNPERVPVVLFTIMFPTVLENLSKAFPEFVSVNETFNANVGVENSYPNAFIGVFDAITESDWAQNSRISSDTRFRILMASLITNVFSNDDKPVAKVFFDSLENGEDITGLHEIVLLSTALYGYNYEGNFCDLVGRYYLNLKAEGFGEDIAEIKAHTVQRERDLSGCTILASECGRIDTEMDNAVFPEGSFGRWNQTNGVQSWLEWLGDASMLWFTQMNDSLWNCIHNGNKAVIPSLSEDSDVFGQMRDITKSILKRAHNVAEACDKPFDVSISGKIHCQRTVSVDVPFEVKVGLFRKETRYRKEKKTESYLDAVSIRFNGWLLEHFERIEDDGDSAAWDYCLGSDGLLYVITSMRKSNGELEYKVSEMIGMFESFFKIASQNTFVSVSHGWMGALDTVPMIPYAQRKYSVQNDMDTYVFDFPLQLGNRSDYPFSKEGDGLKARLDALMK